MENQTNPYRNKQGQYVSLARQRLQKAQQRLLGLRQSAPTVYTDRGAFAKLGIQAFEAKLKLAEIEVGLWEGRSND